ncbi:MAG: hypothetical protein KDD11_21125 [Acidobacteria bacterium]|nr:hypothetical protein [Acidobacteriota bacterium]
MKHVLLSLLLVGTTAQASLAEIGAIDAVPAATLLLPYFEVDSVPGGPATLFSINNASAAPALAHVTLWTDLSRPTLDFDVYLTGYDVVTINLGDLFATGAIPQTGPNFDPGDDAITPGAPGDFSLPDVNFPGCTFPLPAQIPVSLQNYIRALHSGGPAPGGFANAGLCGGIDHADGIYRGYVTIDVANACSLEFPANPGYFVNGGQGIAANDNVLWGDYFLVDPGNNFAQGDPLVHIEAANAGFWSPGDYTFYGRYVGFDASDNREPLATLWAARYFAGTVDTFDEESSIICWRDTGRDESGFFTCGTTPSPFPLGINQTVVFDEQENLVVSETSPFSPPPILPDFIPCPWEATRETASRFGSIFDFGWIYLNLNTIVGSPSDPVKQSFVTTAHSASGLFSVGYQAVHYDSALDKRFQVTVEPRDELLP